MGSTVQFPETRQPEPPDPKFPAPAAHPPVPNDDEKKLETVSFRAPLGTKAYVESRATEIGVKPARFLFSLIERDASEQAAARQQCGRGEDYIVALNREWGIAAADRKITLFERIRLLHVLTDFMRWILGGVRYLGRPA